jgi:hypothetical protein
MKIKFISLIYKNLSARITLCILVIPVLIDLILSDRQGPFRYFTSDTYYYFVTARNIATHNVLGFDYSYPANGFHPLWQIMLGLQYKLIDFLGENEVVFMYSVVITGILLVVLAIKIIEKSILIAGLYIPSSWPLVIIGPFAFSAIPFWIVAQEHFNLVNPGQGLLQLYGTLWSNINGMESGLAVMTFSFFVLCLIRENVASNSMLPKSKNKKKENDKDKTLPKITTSIINLQILVGLSGALMVLARLDTFFIALSGILLQSLLKYLNGYKADLLNQVKYVSIALTVFIIPILLYMISSKLYFDAWMPISGQLKFNLSILSTSSQIVDVMNRPFEGVYWLDAFFRSWQIIVALVCPTIYIIYIGLHFSKNKLLTIEIKDSTSIFGRVIFCLAPGVIIHALYVLLFNRLFSSGSWSFSVSIFYCSLLPFAVIFEKKSTIENVKIEILKVFSWTIICILIFIGLFRRDDYNKNYSDFYFYEAPLVQEYYKGIGIMPRLLEFDDGIISFATGFQSMSGFGFMLDKEAFMAKRRGTLYQLAIDRGNTRAASFIYFIGSPYVNLQPDIDRYKEFISSDYLIPLKEALKDNEVPSVHVEYISPSKRFGIVRFQ